MVCLGLIDFCFIVLINSYVKHKKRIAGVPPGNYDLVALNDAARDWEFGPSEWAQVKDLAKHVEVGDSTQANVDLKATAVRYDTSFCKARLP